MAREIEIEIEMESAQTAGEWPGKGSIREKEGHSFCDAPIH